MAEWIKIAASEVDYTLSDSEFGGMTVLPDGSASFSGFTSSLSSFIWRVTDIANFAPPLSVRVVYIHGSGTLDGTGVIGYSESPNGLFSSERMWDSVIDDFTVEFDISDHHEGGPGSAEFAFKIHGAITNWSGVFEMYVFAESGDGEGDGEGTCFWEDLVNVEQTCGGGGGPPGDVGLSYVTYDNCGGSYGKVTVAMNGDNVAHDFEAALEFASTVMVTGVYQSDTLVEDLEYGGEIGIPDGVVFAEVEYPMSYTGGMFPTWATADDIAELDAQYVFIGRVSVDGAIFYVGGAITTGC